MDETTFSPYINVFLPSPTESFHQYRKGKKKVLAKGQIVGGATRWLVIIALHPKVAIEGHG
jgi:hypothetical protein